MAASAATAGSGLLAPYLSRAADRPALTHGLQSGDLSATSGVVWARADRPARLNIEVATTESFKEVLQRVWVDALPESDLTAKVALDGLPPGQDIFYRVIAQSHAEPAILGEALVFVKAPTPEQGQNLPPSYDTQFFGHVAIDGRTGQMTVTLRDRSDAALWSTTLDPR
jgi:alkaline phosphatase D